MWLQFQFFCHRLKGVNAQRWPTTGKKSGCGNLINHRTWCWLTLLKWSDNSRKGTVIRFLWSHRQAQWHTSISISSVKLWLKNTGNNSLVPISTYGAAIWCLRCLQNRATIISAVFFTSLRICLCLPFLHPSPHEETLWAISLIMQIISNGCVHRDIVITQM